MMRKFDVYYRPRQNTGDGRLLDWQRTTESVDYKQATRIMDTKRREGNFAYIMLCEDGAPVPIKQNLVA